MQHSKQQHAAATTACHDNDTDDNDNVNEYSIKMTTTMQ